MLGRFQNAPVRLWMSFVHHRWLAALIGGYIAICVALAAHADCLGNLSLTLYGAFLIRPVLGAAGFFGGIYLLCLVIRVRPRRPLRFILDQLRIFFGSRGLLTALPIFVLLPPFMSVFTDMKAMIPALHPYHLDQRLAELDRLIHGGIDPWRLLQPLIGHGFTTGILSVTYQVWFLALFGSWLWQAFTRHDPQLRMQFFLTFVLVWGVLGTFGAILFSSGGPAFYGHLVGGDDPFAPLMDYLRSTKTFVPIWALDVQDMLWRSYAAQRTTVGAGISAMPSMHVATALLFALVARRRNRVLGRCAFVFLAAILIGSVHLGWHYALDGYVSIGATLVLWRVAGWITARMPEFARRGLDPVPRPVLA